MAETLSSTILEIKNLSKSYGKFQAVKNISLEVYRGEVFGFLGPNGAGKTTTIKCCSGLLRPTTGSIAVNGHNIVSEAPQAKTLIGYVPDNPFLYDKLTGREFAVFLGRMYRVEDRVLNQRLDSFARLLEIHDSLDQLIQGYSRGMRQKIAIIASLLHQPHLLMLDEPTANLDPKSARAVKDIMVSTKKQGGTVFLSTHVMEIAEVLCDRVAIINKGEIAAIGNVEELRRIKQGKTLEDIFLEITDRKENENQDTLQEITGQGDFR
ncbi:MAG TPA: ABC transporter ATP-binding protein [Dehalococcoidales bacterium]|nr:ABC transporter ATP-binding protein [Dehalococcoidales bacterium]